MDDLNDIEAAIKSTLNNANFPKGPEWFEEHWKPKFDKVRSLMVSPKLMEAMRTVISEMMECDPWHEPFDELQNKPINKL